jgi:hypothetical protein
MEGVNRNEDRNEDHTKVGKRRGKGGFKVFRILGFLIIMALFKSVQAEVSSEWSNLWAGPVIDPVPYMFVNEVADHCQLA